MNLIQINAVRAHLNLAALPVNPNKEAAKKRQAANQAVRAQACRETKALRGSGKKAKG